jgi:hypothetical protein
MHHDIPHVMAEGGLVVTISRVAGRGLPGVAGRGNSVGLPVLKQGGRGCAVRGPAELLIHSCPKILFQWVHRLGALGVPHPVPVGF